MRVVVGCAEGPKALPERGNRDDGTLIITANDALALNITVPDGVEAAARNGNPKLTGAVRRPDPGRRG